MNPPDVIQEVGSRLNLTGLTMAEGICRLVFDRSVPIDIEDDGVGNLYFHTSLGKLPESNREAVLIALMGSHLFGLQTDGAVFGLHPKTHELYLFRSLPVETLEVEGTLKVLERFTQQAQDWRGRIQELIHELGVQSDDESLEPGGIRA